MALVTLKEMIDKNINGDYAVGAVNIMNQDMIRGVIAGAEEVNSPVIISLAEAHEPLVTIEELGPIMIDCAKRAKVPVCVHFDHGETFEAVVRAMKAGFTSVMFDGSKLPFEENIRQTLEIVKIAKTLGISVEAELGELTRPEGCEDEEIEENPDLYTDPYKADEFYKRTGVDALAVAYGTAHGVYAKQPKLDFDRLKLINELTDAPLVMHGGSGLTADDFQTAINYGSKKINYFSNMSYTVAQIVKEKLNSAKVKTYYTDISIWSINAIKDDIAKTLTMFKSNGKAW